MPQSIAANEVAGEEYQDAMRMIGHTINMLTDMGIPREDAALLLPLGMTTRIVDKRNLRNLIDMSRQRMCSRAYWEFRELFNDILDALIEYSDEWKAIATTQMKPKCDVLGYCPEKNGCGKYTKEGER
jgi:thymidylate synthase (FAD)